MLHEFVYKSISVPVELDGAQIEGIVSNAQKNNSEYGVTGMLIYLNGEFLQILEGLKDSVEYVYTKNIAIDKKHSEIKILYSGVIHKRSFQKWSMGFMTDRQIDTANSKHFNLSSIEPFMNRLTDSAKRDSLSLGVAEFIYNYHLMRKQDGRSKV